MGRALFWTRRPRDEGGRAIRDFVVTFPISPRPRNAIEKKTGGAGRTGLRAGAPCRDETFFAGDKPLSKPTILRKRDKVNRQRRQAAACLGANGGDRDARR
jgi:hypothetical protein